MALIKSQDARELMKGAVVVDLTDPHRQAGLLRERAAAQAEQVIAQAHAEAGRILEEAEREGRERGKAEAFQQHDEALRRLQEAWVYAASRWDADRQRTELEARRSLVALAVAMAEKVIRRVPRVDPTVVVDQVAEAVSLVSHAHDAAVRIHPHDRPLVEHHLPQVTRAMGGGRHISIVEDPSIEPGGCVVTSGSAEVDATLGTQLDRIVQAILPTAQAGRSVRGVNAA